MATIPVRFDFDCGNSVILKYTHPLPANLVEARPEDVQQDPQYQSSFTSAIMPIVRQHYPAALAATQTVCSVCAAPKSQANVTPMSYLHVRPDPFVFVILAPICQKSACEIEARQQVQGIMARMSEKAAGVEKKDTVEIKACRVCGKVDETKKCAKCGAVFYCGREHQVQDWPTHKRGCKRP